MPRPAATRRAVGSAAALASRVSPNRPHLVLAAVATGGGIGALGRHGAALVWPTAAGTFPWATFLVNVVGCFGIGMLLVTVTELTGNPHPLLRPFLGTGVLGGFTTFSTYGVEVHELVGAGAPATALGYLFGTVAAGLAAGQAGIWSARLAKDPASRPRWVRE